MNPVRDHPDDTIAAISTPIGEGGIGIARLSGSEALRIADKIFVSKEAKKPSTFKTYTMRHGYIVDEPNTKIIDEVILTVMKAPRSYTKEDIVEINCHGGIQALKKVLELVMRYGARLAEPGEFTKRAFLNGRIDLAQAEAVLDIIRAKTEGSMKVAVHQLEGELSKEVNRIRDEVIEITSRIEASIDFPEDQTEILTDEAVNEKTQNLLTELKTLIETSEDGIVLREGILAVICGKPNVGKSSLMNLLLKRDRVIVTPIPGTTRDAVEEMINLKGVPIRLVDTAGIGATEDLVEKEGIARSVKYLELADLVIFMLDGSTPIELKDLEIAKLIGDKKRLVVINKSDLPKRMDENNAKELFKTDRMIDLSVEKKRNIELLERSMLDMVFRGDFAQGEGAMVTNARHKELLDKSLKNMLSVDRALKENASPEIIAIDLKEAIFNLGLIVGKSVSDDILDRIFEQFCIGK